MADHNSKLTSRGHITWRFGLALALSLLQLVYSCNSWFCGLRTLPTSPNISTSQSLFRIVMVAVKKRSASPVGLVGKPSTFHSSVTLFTASASTAPGPNDNALVLPDGSTSVRRSKRIKLEQTEYAVPDQDENHSEFSDSEPSPPRKRKTRGNVKNAIASSSTIKVEEVDVKTIVTPTKKSKKQTSPRKPKPIQQVLAVPHPAPLQWKETYDTIRRMRENIVAPVDTMGCDQAQHKEQDPKVRSQ